MNYQNLPILSIVTFFPLIGIFIIFFIRKDNYRLIQWIAFITALIDFILSVPLYFSFDSSQWKMQFIENIPWIEQFGIYYSMGIDGISLPLVLLTTFLSAIAILSTWTAVTEKVKGYMISLLFLETGMIGVYCALDFILFYIFWEVMLVPMYFIIGIWGGPRRLYAAIKFFLYTMFGSSLMLVAILVLYFINHSQTGVYSFSIPKFFGMNLSMNLQFWLFLAFFIAFGIKVPIFPFHTWLPDAHVEAPTAGSVILAGVLLKMGTYGFLRISLPMLPQASMNFIPFISVLGIIGVIYGAMVSLAQEDIKKLVAYSSVSHLGLCMLGMFAMNTAGIQGSILQMVNHGLSTGALFLMVGIIYEQRHTRLISEYGGLWKVIPVFTIIFLLVVFSSMGVPGLNGFVSEILILIGVFKRNIWFGTIVTVGLILDTVYLLWMFQRVVLGEITKDENRHLKDINKRELLCLLPIILFIIWIGVYPRPFLNKMQVSVEHLIEQVKFNNNTITEDGEQEAHFSYGNFNTND